jgi:ribonucleoside-diphosphate reductase alpha subunit
MASLSSDAAAPAVVVVVDPSGATPFSATQLMASLAAHTVLTLGQAASVVEDIVQNLPPSLTHRQLDDLVMRRLASTMDCDYQDAAGQYDYEMLRRTLPETYVEVCERIRGNTVQAGGSADVPAPRLSVKFIEFVRAHAAALDQLLRDVLCDKERRVYSFFSMQTMRRTYLLKVHDETAELPEHMFLREAIQVTAYDMARIPETFRLLAFQYYTHASPTMFNSGAPVPQLASCFLLDVGDSIESIFDTVKKCAIISKTGGGIGLNVQPIRSLGTAIKSGGESNGLCPMLKVFESTTSYVSQGNKRRGSCAIYMEVWNKQVFDHCELRLNTGGETNRCRDLFTALLLNDVFMARVKANGRWSLFCVTDTPDLPNLYGPAFTARYETYEADLARYNGRSVRARSVFKAIIKSMQETGTPYLIAKSHLNKSPHTGLFGPGSTVRTSNLCGEICQYTDTDHTAVCNLATVKLDRFVRFRGEGGEDNGEGEPYFDWPHFRRVVRIMTRNLDNTLDDSFYPTACAKRMNLCCRPLGMGIQALADLFIAMRMPFNSPEALKLDGDIAEVMYFEAVTASCDLADERGAYPRFEHSRLAKEGVLQFDFYGPAVTAKVYAEGMVGAKAWEALRARARKGVRNSLLIAHPPTASTASCMGSTEAFEPVYKLAYARKVSAGVFLQLLRSLFDTLKRRGMWNEDVKQLLIKDWGSLARIPLPAKDKALFVTAMDMSMRLYIDHAIKRAIFNDQSASLNHFYKDPTYQKLSSAIFYAFNGGLKTLSYYIRRRPRKEQNQFASISDAVAAKIAQRLQRHFGDGEDVEGVELGSYVPLLTKSRAIQQRTDAHQPRTPATAAGAGAGAGAGAASTRAEPRDMADPDDCVMCGS